MNLSKKEKPIREDYSSNLAYFPLFMNIRGQNCWIPEITDFYDYYNASFKEMP